MPPTVVWRFGGTSVAEPLPLHAVAERTVAAQQPGPRVARPQLPDLHALFSVGERIACALGPDADAESLGPTADRGLPVRDWRT
jgi:hypothetical protein